MDINENVEIVKSPDEIYCSSCGKPIKKEAEICPHCGVRNKNSLSSSKINDGMRCMKNAPIFCQIVNPCSKASAANKLIKRIARIQIIRGDQ